MTSAFGVVHELAKAYEHSYHRGRRRVVQNPRPAESGRGPTGLRITAGNSGGDYGHGTGECPTCGLNVGKKTDGSLRSHWVGGTAKRGWKCPGVEGIARGMR